MMTTATMQAEILPDLAYSWRPYANSENVYKSVETPEGQRIFTVDPWTQRWAVLHHAAAALLRLADGSDRRSGASDS